MNFNFKKYITAPVLATTLAVSALIPTQASAGIEPYVGEIMLFGPSFCPRGWAHANGQLLQIANNQALFALLGTMYGGDGRTTFALPDLRGRLPIGMGQGPGLGTYNQGQIFGHESVTLKNSNMPAQSLSVTIPTVKTQQKGTTAGLATAKAGANATLTLNSKGRGQPISVRNPVLVLNYCISLQGNFPSRS